MFLPKINEMEFPLDELFSEIRRLEFLSLAQVLANFVSLAGASLPAHPLRIVASARILPVKVRRFLDITSANQHDYPDFRRMRSIIEWGRSPGIGSSMAIGFPFD